MEILFAVGLALGLANEARGRAALEALVLYMTFNVFVSSILAGFGSTFGVDLDAADALGIKAICGIRTLDTGFLGALLVSAVIVWVHNRCFRRRLPEWLGIFQGSALVGAAGFPVMLALALAFCAIWPTVQAAISSLQFFMSHAGLLGVWIYTFLEKALLPTGLHHFISAPFEYGPAIVEGGTIPYWMRHMNEFAASTQPLSILFPQGGFSLQGLSNFFGVPGIALAFFATARKGNRQRVLALCVPGVITSVLCGITEPFDYTFLFLAPVLFFVHAFLAATFATIEFACGVSGDMGSGLIAISAKNFIPMWQNHWMAFAIMFAIGAVSILTYFLVFRFLILRFGFNTPGRSNTVRMFGKSDVHSRIAEKADGETSCSKEAAGYLAALGGAKNIRSCANCMTRLRVTVADENLVLADEAFTACGAKGVVRNGKAIQVIIGLAVPQVKEAFSKLADVRGGDAEPQND